MIIKTVRVSGVGGVPESFTMNFLPGTQTIRRPNRAGKTSMVKLIRYALSGTLPPNHSLRQLIYAPSKGEPKPASIAITLSQPETGNEYVLTGEIDPNLNEKWQLHQTGYKEPIATNGNARLKLSEVAGNESLSNIAAKIIIPSLVEKKLKDFISNLSSLTGVQLVKDAYDKVQKAQQLAIKQHGQVTAELSSLLQSQQAKEYGIGSDIKPADLPSKLMSITSSMRTELTSTQQGLTRIQERLQELKNEQIQLTKETEGLKVEGKRFSALSQKMLTLQPELEQKINFLNTANEEVKRIQKDNEKYKAKIAELEKERLGKTKVLEQFEETTNMNAKAAKAYEAGIGILDKEIGNLKATLKSTTEYVEQLELEIKNSEKSYGRIPPELLAKIDAAGLLDKGLFKSWRQISAMIEEERRRIDSMIISLNSQLSKSEAQAALVILQQLKTLSDQRSLKQTPATSSQPQMDCPVCGTSVQPEEKTHVLNCPICRNDLPPDKIRVLIDSKVKHLSSINYQLKQLEATRDTLKSINNDEILGKFLTLRDRLDPTNKKLSETKQQLQDADKRKRDLQSQLASLKLGQVPNQPVAQAQSMVDDANTEITRLQTMIEQNDKQLSYLSQQIGSLKGGIDDINQRLQRLKADSSSKATQEYEKRQTSLDVRGQRSTEEIQDLLSKRGDLIKAEGDLNTKIKEITETTELVTKYVDYLSQSNRERDNLTKVLQILPVLQHSLQTEVDQALASGIATTLKELGISYRGIRKEETETYLLLDDWLGKGTVKVRFEDLSESEVINLLVTTALKSGVWSKDNKKEFKTFILDAAQALDAKTKSALTTVMSRFMNHTHPQVVFFEPQ